MKHAWTCGLLLALMAAGCGGGNGDDAAKDFPAPGHMKVLSMAPTASAERGSLLKNGDFDDWYAGAPFPEGAQVTDANLIYCFSTPQAFKGGLPSRFQANQVWKAPDEALPPQQHFGIFGDGLEAGGKYKLHVAATGIDGMTAKLSVYEVDGDKYELVAKDLITTDAVRDKEYNATFTAKKGGRFIVISTAGPMPKKSGRMVWHLWAVTLA